MALLPLKPDVKNLFIAGPFASDAYVQLSNYYGLSGNIVTILEGITDAVSPGTTIEHKVGFLPFRENINPIDWVTGDAHRYEVIIAVLGISNYLEGEEGDALASEFKGDRLDLSLPANQIEFLKKLRENGDKPIISIVLGGSPAFMEEVHENSDAVLWAWYPGEQGGTAVADVIFGKENPSGRLPISFPRRDQELPAYEDYSMTNRTYRYFKEEPFYPFGYGLSFTKFSYTNLTFSEGQATVTVKNEGETTGEEVVQLYLNFEVKGETMPNYALKAFERVSLEPGESQQVTFNLGDEMLTYYTSDGKQKLHMKDFKIYVGGSCPSPRAEELGSPACQILTPTR